MAMSDTFSDLTSYRTWFDELKRQVEQALQRVAFAANQDVVALYWRLGRDIIERQAHRGWTAKIVERLSDDLQAVLSGVKIFRRTSRNICVPW